MSDDALSDVVSKTTELEQKLNAEKSRYAHLVKSECEKEKDLSTWPSYHYWNSESNHISNLSISKCTITDALSQARPEVYASGQYMHEGFRVATLLVLNAFVLDSPPNSAQVRLLVRQALSLLEVMYEQSLPGFCSAHFVIFTTALCAAPGGLSHDGKLDDRERVERLYDNTL